MKNLPTCRNTGKADLMQSVKFVINICILKKKNDLQSRPNIT